jgi:hypothetical protein
MTNSGHRFNTAEELAVCLLMALCMNPANCFQWLDSPPYGLVRYLPFVLTIGYLQTACEQGSLCPPNTYLRTITWLDQHDRQTAYHQTEQSQHHHIQSTNNNIITQKCPRNPKLSRPLQSEQQQTWATNQMHRNNNRYRHQPTTPTLASNTTRLPNKKMPPFVIFVHPAPSLWSPNLHHIPPKSHTT